MKLVLREKESMKLSNATWTEVEVYLKSKNTLIIPIGSTEQHGPTGLIGTDYVTAQRISEAVGAKLGVYVAPPICYGMALHHMAFPGSAALKPSTLLQMVLEIIESFKKHGFKKIVFVNGHGGNIPTVTAAFSEVKSGSDNSILELINWWRLQEVQAYETEHFGDQNGFHATVGEVAVTMHLEPEAFDKIPNTQFKIERPKHHWPMGPEEFRKTFFDGRMESNPGLATKHHGEKIFQIAVDAIAHKVDEVIKA